MVDEYQDTNHAQHELTKLITGDHRNICVVGDPNQSIYAWRNALIRNILDFPKHYPGAEVVHLGRNYRSSENIVQSAAALISHNPTRIDNPLSANDREGPLLRIAATSDDDTQAYWTLQNMQRLVRRKHCAWNDCAVMYRTNAQSRAFEELCIQNRIPYRIIGGVRFYQRKEIKDLLAYLRIVHNPGDSVSLQRIINTPPRSIGAVTIQKIQQFADRRTLTLMQGTRAAVAVPQPGERPDPRRPAHRRGVPLRRPRRPPLRRPRRPRPPRHHRHDHPGDQPLRLHQGRGQRPRALGECPGAPGLHHPARVRRPERPHPRSPPSSSTSPCSPRPTTTTPPPTR